METIEESEEEDEMEDENEVVEQEEMDEVLISRSADESEEDVVVPAALEVESSISPPQLSPVSRSVSCSALQTSPNEEKLSEKVQYYEFLSFLNAAGSPRSMPIKEDDIHEENEGDFFEVLKSSTVGDAQQVHYMVQEEEKREEYHDEEGSVTSNLTTDSQRSKNSVSSIKRRLSKGSKRTLKKLKSSVW